MCQLVEFRIPTLEQGSFRKCLAAKLVAGHDLPA